MRKGLAQILAPVIVGGLLVLGIVALNSLLRGYFHDSQRCTIKFSEIECLPPGKLSREEFLGEVQYLANWPDEINLLDEKLTARLHLSFAAHPWVESVERVRIIPPRQVLVLLRYRTPVLGIPDKDAGTAPWLPFLTKPFVIKVPGRVVDRQGIILPLAAIDERVPVLVGNVPPPVGLSGQPWGDPGVVRAAAVASLLAPYQEELQLQRFQIIEGVLILSGERARVVWGKVVNDETANDAADNVKLQRLLEWIQKAGSVENWKCDLTAS
jgi:hypothetical protein